MKKDHLKSYVDALREYDHCFLTREGALYFSRPFGFEAKTYVVRAEPEHPKGLTLYDGAASAEGVDASDLAVQICRHLKIKCTTAIGRGFQLRFACEALERWIEL